MVDLAKSYMTNFLSEGRTALAETLFDEAIVHTDPIWVRRQREGARAERDVSSRRQQLTKCPPLAHRQDPGNATVGVQGMRAYAEDLRAAFPDLALHIEELASPDTRSLVVLYAGHATGLGPYHAAEKASHRFSALRGAAVMRFDPDRSRIVRIEGTCISKMGRRNGVLARRKPRRPLAALTWLLVPAQCSARHLWRTGWSCRCGTRWATAASASCASTAWSDRVPRAAPPRVPAPAPAVRAARSGSEERLGLRAWDNVCMGKCLLTALHGARP